VSETDEKRETLGEISEAEILSRVFPRLPVSAHELLGPGDDAAVISAPDGRYVVTTDMMVEGPDFRTDWSSPFQIGYKAAAINLADVAAMGAVPTALVVALGAPAHAGVSDLEQIADGLRAACDELAPGCGVVGGDLSSAPALVLSITAHGDLESREPLTRSGARAGDIVAVAGELGAAGLGLDLLFARGIEAHAEFATVLDAQLQPRPHIGLGRVAARSAATAAMDVSDGLALDATRMARASEVRIDLSSELLSAFVGALRDAAPGISASDDELLDYVLYSGESHALLVCFSPQASIPAGFAPIGVVTGLTGDEPGVFLDGAPLDARGWHPFQTG